VIITGFNGLDTKVNEKAPRGNMMVNGMGDIDAAHRVDTAVIKALLPAEQVQQIQEILS
jgi:hypothetical protein